MSIERWLPVAGYEGIYEVSDQGRVRSLDRVVNGPRGRKSKRKGKVLKPCIEGFGYPTVGLCKEGISRTVRVHVLVAEAFLGPRPEGLEVRHLDDVKTNNVPANLAYGTASENRYDSVRNGTHPSVRTSSRRCRRGHALVEPNTRDRKPRRPLCLSCELAGIEVRRLIPIPPMSEREARAQEIADRIYAEIMGAVQEVA